MKWFPRACPVCAGDLHEDLDLAGWVQCFMCARSFRLTELHPASAQEIRQLATTQTLRQSLPKVA